MDVTTLRWFQQVADGVTVTEVSDLEQVSQSGVSRALARLESELGVPLLRRSGRILRMTQAGATFKRHVDRSLHELDDGIAALSALSDPATGSVVVAFQATLGTWLVPELVAGFRGMYPDVHFVLHQVRDELRGPTLLDGVADLEITTVPAQDPAIRWRPLLGQALRLAVPAGHALGRRRRASLREVANDAFVMLTPAFALRRTCEELCAQAGFTPQVAFEGDDVATVLGFVGAGLGVAVVPVRPGGSDPGQGVRFLALDDPGADRQIGLAWSRERRLLPAAGNFRRYVVEQLTGRAAE